MITLDSAAAVNALADSYWEAYLEQNPTTATVYGDDRWDDRLADPSPAGRRAARALRDATLAELATIPVVRLAVEERITPGRHAGPPGEAAGAAGCLRAVHRRSRGPSRGGADDRHDRPPRIVAERTISQAERLLAVAADESPIVTGARLADGDDARRARVAAVVRDVVNPALARYVEALRGPYFAATREDPGLWSAPDGAARYRMAIRTWTSLDLDPADVHQIGLEELAALDADRLSIARAAGFDSVAAYRAHLASDPANQVVAKEDLVARANEDIARALAVAPRWFGRLPVAPCQVRPVEPFMERDAPPAFCYPPTIDDSRPGIYFVNTYDLPTRRLSALASTTYHEAVLGHHFQIALEMETPGLPAFRRLGGRMVGSAYAEGWGLYSERFADEMGLYRTDAERFGMLEGQAWRAVRLIVDTGIHALRRDRAWAVDLLREGAGLSATDAGIEADRYIVWPGQALTYKSGHREITRLRTELAARDGDAFDLRAFHDAVLGHGSLPLATLARELPSWVAPTAG